MAHVTLLDIDALAFEGDAIPIVGGDAIGVLTHIQGDWFWAFDATNEEAVISRRMRMPGQYAGGTLMATPCGIFASETTVTDEAVLEVRVEAVTAPTDEIDLDAGTSFDAANVIEIDPRTTAGWPCQTQAELVNKDSVAASDWVRFHVRRNCAHASDTATGDVYFQGLEIWEDT